MGLMPVLISISAGYGPTRQYLLGAVENITNPYITTQYKVIVYVSEAVVDQGGGNNGSGAVDYCVWDRRSEGVKE